MANNDIFIALKQDEKYVHWITELKRRYLSQRLKAACAVSTNMLEFYWSMGCDIESKPYANIYGSGFYNNLSKDMKRGVT